MTRRDFTPADIHHFAALWMKVDLADDVNLVVFGISLKLGLGKIGPNLHGLHIVHEINTRERLSCCHQ